MQSDCDDACEVWHAEEVRAEFLRLAKPSTDHTDCKHADPATHPDRRVAKLCSAFTRFQADELALLRERNRTTPVLICYQADATSYLTMFRRRFQVQGAARPDMVRAGHDLCEFLTERVFAAASRDDRVHDKVSLVGVPRLLQKGKTASVHMSAMRDLLSHPHAREQHQSIAVSFYSWDRAIFSACSRLAHQLHVEHWQQHAQLASDGAAHQYPEQDIVLAVGCAIHDAASGLRWATNHLLEQDERKKLYNLIEGLRSGCRFLYAVIDEFLN